MDKKNLKEREKKPTSPAQVALAFLIIIGVIALGLVAVNQYLALRYKAVWLSTPCDLCSSLNEHLRPCFRQASIVTIDPITGEVITNVSEFQQQKNKDLGDFNISKYIIPSS